MRERSSYRAVRRNARVRGPGGPAFHRLAGDSFAKPFDATKIRVATGVSRGIDYSKTHRARAIDTVNRVLVTE